MIPDAAVSPVITAAVRRSDFGAFATLTEAPARPCDDQPALAHLADPPEPHERVRRTFCGM